jgi:DNA polymerase (family X)
LYLLPTVHCELNMTNAAIAAALSEIGTLLELKGENPFRTQSYHAVARVIDQLTDDVAQRVIAGDLGKIPGVGDAIKEKIELLVRTGSIPQLDELRANTPPGLIQMLRVPGLGPKKVRALADTGIDDLVALKTACDAGTVAKLKGFGAKTQTNILNGIAFLEKAGGRIRIDVADALAQPVVAMLRGLKGVKRAEACGSLRRRKETIGDLDFLASAKDAGSVMDAFGAMPSVSQVINRGETLTSVLLTVGSGPAATTIRADLRVVSDAQFPFGLAYFTGSKEHNIVMRSRAQERGLKLNEYALAGAKGDVACKSEEDIFHALGLTYVPPEIREDSGEFAASEKKTLPKLIAVEDIRGVFHNHTTASDGSNSLEEMAAAAQSLGFEYLGIADHSQSLNVARGLTPERVREQHKKIDALNKTFKGFRILKGTECDIMPDGSLDFDDDVLASFDYVVASVHTHFQQSREEVTARIVRAVRHPKVTMLGHATGRLLLQRDGYPVDLGAVFAAATESGTTIEINAQPKRLDVDWIHARRAKEMGIPIVINPDAHATDELALFRYGVDVARRAWLTADDVINTRSLQDIEKLLKI